jgi:ubiquinone/menaquinone biosynthesis C-methylase UbiE
MSARSIEAYEQASRVARYDADMDLMHPNRHKMVEVALEILPFEKRTPIRALDLGTGTGFFAGRFLETYPHATVLGVDGSAAMLDLARVRLKDFTGRNAIQFLESAFQDLETTLPRGQAFDLVFSAYALHHLSPPEKRLLISAIVDRLAPGGWFINADLVSHPHPDIEHAIQDARAAGILQRNSGRDPRFADLGAIRTFLDELESTEDDQPISIESDLAIAKECGIRNATLFWKEYREVVYGGSIDV